MRLELGREPREGFLEGVMASRGREQDVGSAEGSAKDHGDT